MKINSILISILVVLGFGSSCAHRGMKNYAPESDQRPNPAASTSTPGLTPGPVEVLRPAPGTTPTAYGVVLVPFDPDKNTKDTPSRADSTATPTVTAPADVQPVSEVDTLKISE